MDLPFISVAIITYNQKVFLEECIESILNQDYPNFEIIVADDCSQDGTKEMLLDYDKMYPNRFVLKIAQFTWQKVGFQILYVDNLLLQPFL